MNRAAIPARRSTTLTPLPELKRVEIVDIQEVRRKRLDIEKLELQNEKLRREIAADDAERDNVVLSRALAEELNPRAIGRLTGHWKSSSSAIFRIEDFDDRIIIVNMSRPEFTYDCKRMGSLALIDFFVGGNRTQFALKQTSNSNLILGKIKFSAKDSSPEILKKAEKSFLKATAVWVRLN